MHPALGVDDAAELPGLQRKGRVLKRRLHLAAPEDAQVAPALGARAVALSLCNRRKRLARSQPSRDGVQGGNGLLLGARHHRLAEGAGAAAAGMLDENVARAHCAAVVLYARPLAAGAHGRRRARAGAAGGGGAALARVRTMRRKHLLAE